jgi:hypothetical protein
VHVIQNAAATVMLPTKVVSRIGAVDGEPEYNLFHVSASQIDAAGNYYVGMEYEVRVYDRNGNYIRRIGRQGKGPGEFNYAPLLWSAGDTLVANDRNLMRSTAFSKDGKVLGTYNAWSHPHRTVHVLGRTAGSWVALVDADGKEDDSDVVLQRQLANTKLAPGALGEMPALEFYRYYPQTDSIGALLYKAHNRRLVGIAPTSQNPMGLSVRPFDDEPSYALDGRGMMFLKYPNEYRIDVHDARGKLTSSIRRAYTRIPITTADFEGLPRMMVENMSRSMTVVSGSLEATQARMLASFTRQVEQMQKLPLPPGRYPIGRLIASPGGTLMAERADYMKPAVREALKSGPNRVATRWDMFDPTGRYFGTIDLPVGYRVHSMTDSGKITGVYKDDDGIEFVIVYQVGRAGPSAGR